MLSTHGLACSRGPKRLFDGLDLSVEAGTWVHVRGENGAGKTSLLRLLAGLSIPDAGDVRWRGESIGRSASQWRRDMLFLGHQPAVKEELTPLENLQLAGELDGCPVGDADALRALRRFGLAGREELPVRFLSAGQRRRVLLARMLGRPAKAWILDEPLTVLDTPAIETFAQVVGEHLGRGGLAVVTSHQPIPVPGGKEVLL